MHNLHLIITKHSCSIYQIFPILSINLKILINLHVIYKFNLHTYIQWFPIVVQCDKFDFSDTGGGYPLVVICDGLQHLSSCLQMRVAIVPGAQAGEANGLVSFLISYSHTFINHIMKNLKKEKIAYVTAYNMFSVLRLIDYTAFYVVSAIF